MTSRANLDFFAPPLERRQCVRERMAQLRAPMYEWRRDFAESAFDAATGERRPLRRVFNPAAKEHPVAAHSVRAATRNADANAAYKEVEQSNNVPPPPPKQRWSRRQWSPQRTLGSGNAAATRAYSARPAAATVWEGAASGTTDRRHMWKQSGFTFAEDYFRKSAQVPMSQTHLGAAASEARRGVGRCGVYVPYLHDTILFCEPRQHPMKTRRSRPDGGDGTATAANELPPVHRASSAAGVVMAVTFNAAESRGWELHASMDAKRTELLSFSVSTPFQKLQQQPVAYLYAAGAERFTDDDDDDDDTPRAAGAIASGANDVNRAATAKAETCYDVVGPSIAVKQRAVAMAEGLYTDLIATRARARSAAAKTEVPTCELGYTLRPSYVQSRLRRSAARHGSSSQNVGIATIVSDCYSASLDEGMSGTTPHTTAATSPMTAHASAPRMHGHRGNGVSGPPSERTITRSPRNESITGAAPPAAIEAALTDAIAFSQCSDGTVRQGSITSAPPPALSPAELGNDMDDTEEARSPDGGGDGALPREFPTAATAGGQVEYRQSGPPPASPSQSGTNAQLRPDSHPSLSLLYRTGNSTDSPTLLRTCGDGGGSTVAGGSNYSGGEWHRGHPRHVRDAKHTPHQSPRSQRKCGYMSYDAQQQHQQSPTACRLPAESKETRVYAVRVRRLFTNADASLLKCAEPKRHAIPVMLPPDWQPNC
ncbi:hypothetical protein LPMP_010540 [Leishmania panamensis]|uniref:Uncharacterized protein n=1 Tax=Leishmania panamensis TaxID=5679 RepID=A0A088RJ66_LEIPA|nr:hypothetical protein LPMP_010540 [Leishmania panamensis]AIN95154.1 hypothetical protein LPMP_010540 [Leishmania panamensis]